MLALVLEIRRRVSKVTTVLIYKNLIKFVHVRYHARPSLVAQLIKNSPAVRDTWVWSLGWEDPLEKGKATHNSLLAWRIPWTVSSMGLQRVRHNWATFTLRHTRASQVAPVVKNPTCQYGKGKRCEFHPWVRKISWSRKWQPTPIFLPGKFYGRRSLAGYSPWGFKELDATEHIIIIDTVLSKVAQH